MSARRRKPMHTDAEEESKRGSFGYTDMQLYKFMFSYIIPYKRDLIIISIYMILYSLVTSLSPLLILVSINQFSEHRTGNIFGNKLLDGPSYVIIDYFENVFPNIAQFWFEAGFIVILYTILQIMTFYFQREMQNYIGAMGYKAELAIRLDMFEHLQELDLSYHDKNEVGRIMSRLTSDLSAIREMLGGQVISNLANILTVVTVGIIIVLIDPVLSLIPLLLIPIVIYIGSLSRKYARPRRKETRRTNSILMANIGESIAGIKVTKGHSRENRNIDIFRELNEANTRANIDADNMNAIFFPLLLLMSSLGTISIILVGGIRVIDGAITVGALVAFLNYNAILFRPIILLGQFYQQLQDALTGAERIYALFDTETKVPYNNQLPDMPLIKGEVIFDRVRFEYVPGKPIYDQFSLYVPPGKTIALVGHTGAGKTTIINILSRLYEFQGGELRIDGTDVTTVSLKSYKGQIVAVPQDYFIFSTSVRENLKLGNPMATDEDMWDALEKVGLKKYIQSYESGLDTHLQERGGRLSVGQRQLLIFAAVLLAKPRILILDEATSSIDVFSEIQIQKTIQLLLKDCTSFIIAHRLSTIRNADSIIVIDDGNIVEQGTHEELIAQKGQYYDLVRNQIELAGVE